MQLLMQLYHSEHNNLYQSATTECFTRLLTHILTSSLCRVMKGREKRKEQESLRKLRPFLDHDERRPGGHSLELLCSQLVFEMQKLQNLNPVTLHPIIRVNLRQSAYIFSKRITIHCYFCYYMTITMFCKPNKTLDHHYGNNALLYLWTHLTVITLSRERLLRTGDKYLGHSITFPPVRVATCWSEMWNTG